MIKWEAVGVAFPWAAGPLKLLELQVHGSLFLNQIKKKKSDDLSAK